MVSAMSRFRKQCRTGSLSEFLSGESIATGSVDRHRRKMIYRRLSMFNDAPSVRALGR
jgi:hypothetical protein